jgi:hypothetical protein
MSLSVLCICSYSCVNVHPAYYYYHFQTEKLANLIVYLRWEARSIGRNTASLARSWGLHTRVSYPFFVHPLIIIFNFSIPVNTFVRHE